MQYLHRKSSNLSLNAVLFFLSCLMLATFHAHAGEQTKAKDVVAIQLRAQGIPCTAPLRTEKDKIDSRPDEMAWIISCKEATYRVTLIPHVGAKVDIVAPTGLKPTMLK
jgi:hypothetical protein